MKVALVTGITGQDGAYLSQLLLDKGYRVIGGLRRTSASSTWRLEELGIANRIEYCGLELLEPHNVSELIARYRPDEVYNLAAQSFVAASFEQPIYTSNVNALGPLRLLEAVRRVSPETRFYQASTSEMFGLIKTDPQNELTPFHPRSPYGCSKLFAHWTAINYREAFGMFACCGILFNHESPFRGLEFVTRKISSAMARLRAGQLDCLELGNLDATRDWGHAADYVEGMWRMLQSGQPDDYVLATGSSRSVREFVNVAAQAAGFDIEWVGGGTEERGLDRSSRRLIVRVNPAHYRPAEVHQLRGDASKAERQLGWRPKTPFEALVNEMVAKDIARLESRGSLQ